MLYISCRFFVYLEETSLVPSDLSVDVNGFVEDVFKTSTTDSINVADIFQTTSADDNTDLNAFLDEVFSTSSNLNTDLNAFLDDVFDPAPMNEKGTN